MSTPDVALELYKLEYEKAAERYENIYQAVWTNFSYMAAVAAGILSFGSSAFQIKEVPVLLACIPLFFWYLATFLPLNEYGDQVMQRLRDLESTFNKKYGMDLSHYTRYAGRVTEWRKVFESVRFALLMFFSLLFTAAIVLGARIFYTLGEWREYKTLGVVAVITGLLILAGLVRGAKQTISYVHPDPTSNPN
jgi:magnesium-transporting ATPase (P-type)